MPVTNFEEDQGLPDRFPRCRVHGHGSAHAGARFPIMPPKCGDLVRQRERPDLVRSLSLSPATYVCEEFGSLVPSESYWRLKEHVSRRILDHPLQKSGGAFLVE